MPRLLFDASSLLAALKAGRVRILLGECTQCLAIYEVCNGLWKEIHVLGKLTREEALHVVNVLKEVVEYMEVLSIHPYEEEVLSIALSTGLTAYDASYIVAAIKRRLTLVTEDRQLKRAAARYVETRSVGELAVG